MANDSDSELSMQRSKSESFEKSRLNHCIRLFEAEIARKQRIENKSRFYMSFVAIILGAIFLNPDFLKDLVSMLQVASCTLTAATYVFQTLLAVFLVFSLTSILGVMSVKDYKRGSPPDLSSSLFAPYSKYYKRSDEPSLHRATAKTYALAAERNGENNEQKGRWLWLTSYGVIGVLLSLAGLISCFILLLLS